MLSFHRGPKIQVNQAQIIKMAFRQLKNLQDLFFIVAMDISKLKIYVTWYQQNELAESKES
jgi:hypothetical protein